MFPATTDRLIANLKETFQYIEASPPERALYLWHPHALLSLTPFFHTYWQKRSKVVCLNFFHRIPVVRDLYHYVGAIGSDYEPMKATLETTSVSVIPGGVREMMIPCTPGVLQVVLKSRSGVFRLALETGTPLVPVLTYGESELFPQIEHPLLKTLNVWLYSKFGLFVPIPSLTSLQNWVRLSESPLPPIQSFAGSPIPVEKTLNPTQEQIETLRETYIANLQTLFDETAPKGLKLVVE